MTTLILILLPLVISSLGFLTYRHPPIARKILAPFYLVAVAIYLLLSIFYIGQSSAYYKALNAVRFDVYNPNYKALNIDSLYKFVHDKDSIMLIIHDAQNQVDNSHKIAEYQTLLKDSIQTNIQSVLQKNKDTYNDNSLYCLAAFLILIILYGLSFLFNNIHNKEKVTDVNHADK